MNLQRYLLLLQPCFRRCRFSLFPFCLSVCPLWLRLWLLLLLALLLVLRLFLLLTLVLAWSLLLRLLPLVLRRLLRMPPSLGLLEGVPRTAYTRSETLPSLLLLV